LLTDGEQVKILDFGLAKVRDSMHVIKDGCLSGTLAYMSPEQACGEEVDHRTDIWSLGVVLYEMLTTQLPFKGHYPQEIQFSIVHEDIESFDMVSSATPRELAEIVNKALKKDSRDRYQSMQAVVADLVFLRSRSRHETSIRDVCLAATAIPRVVNAGNVSVYPNNGQEIHSVIKR
jgi:serine/threonine-protein kinase